MTEKIFSPSNCCLRFLFLVALFSVRAFLLHLSKRLCHVFELIPNIKAYVDWRGLLSRHRDTIAGPRINLDDLLLFQFVLRTEDKSRKIGAVLEIVDDYPFDLRFEGSQDIREQIMGERSLLLRALLEHRDRRPNALINEHRENLVLVAKKNRAAAARRNEAADLHFDNGLTHTASPVISFPPGSELLSTADQKPNHSVLCPCPVKNSIRSSFRPTFKGHACSAAHTLE